MAFGFSIDTSRPTYGVWKFGWIVDGSNPIQAWMLPPPYTFIPTTVVLEPLRVVDRERLPNQAIAFYQIRNDGSVRQRLRAGDSQLAMWMDGDIRPELFEARMVHLNGDPFDGPVGSWLGLEQNREWGVTRSTVGVTRAVGRIEIRKVGETTVLAQARIIARAVVRA